MAEEEQREEPVKCECGAEMWVARESGKRDGFVCINPGCPFNYAKREGPRGEKVRLLTQREARKEVREEARIRKNMHVKKRREAREETKEEVKEVE